MKKVSVIVITALLLIGSHMAYLIAGKNDIHIETKQNSETYFLEIKKGIDLIEMEKLSDLRVDEYFLLKKIKEKRSLQNINLKTLKKQFADDPFKRLTYKNDIVSDIKIERKDVVSAIGENFNGNFYSVTSTGGSFGAWNDILVKALYCDISKYDSQDFFVLNLMHKQNGGYFDTHFLLALMLLKENKCWEEIKINEQIEKVSRDIIKAIENDKSFGDLYSERIVFLYWAGYGDEIKKEWIEWIKNNFDAEYGWQDERKPGLNMHTTGLSLLAMIYFDEKENKQSIY
ncbi:MAG: hypothetical protein ACD_56C00068G0002 [uncultured bacterium]|nr:MAG: hypothetical protein ACD_56C00068G0002 [uncultured bacterium]